MGAPGGNNNKRNVPAVISLVIALFLLAVTVLVGVLYQRQPPPLSGIEGMGWFVMLMWGFSLLIYSAYIGGPLAIVLGVWGWWRAQRAPERFSRAWLACCGVVIAVMVMAATAAAHVSMRIALSEFYATAADAQDGAEPVNYSAVDDR